MIIVVSSVQAEYGRRYIPDEDRILSTVVSLAGPTFSPS